MKFSAAARVFGVVLLAGVLLDGAAAVPARADVVPEDCAVLAAGDLGRPLHATFTDAAEAGCLELPLPAKTVVAVTQPLAGSSAVWVDLTLVDAGGMVVCGSVPLTYDACTLRGAAPFRLVTAPVTAGATEDYQVEVLPLAADAGCAAQVPAGTVGSDTGVDATLSADAFTACYSIPADGHSTTELFTVARTAGSGNAKVIVFSQSGTRACPGISRPAAAAVFWCSLNPGQAYTFAVWGDAAPATFRLSLCAKSRPGH